MHDANRPLTALFVLAVSALACGDDEPTNPFQPPVAQGGAAAAPAGGSGGTTGGQGMSGAGQAGGQSAGGSAQAGAGGLSSGGAAGSPGGGQAGAEPGAGGGSLGGGKALPFPDLALVPIATGLDSPLTVLQAPGESSRLLVVERSGVVQIVEKGQALDTPFLDISDRVLAGGERGLLGMAFHPDFEKNGLFYVHYSLDRSGAGVTSEFSVSAKDRSLADASTERVLLTVDQPESNHNGGHLAFGPEGFLFVGLGDGGGRGDRHGAIGNGQNLQTLLGKLLRIDVNGRGVDNAYSIPEGNMGGKALPEIWNYGLRNPWRFSFDRENGDLYIADVGQDDLEEIDYEPAGTGSGQNYGWRRMEGDRCFNPFLGCERDDLVLPVATYGRLEGVSVTGGFVYRGSALPGLRGYYLYADFSTGNFWALRTEGGAVAEPAVRITDNINPGREVRSISSFGEDSAGELYVSSLTGTVYRIEAAP